MDIGSGYTTGDEAMLCHLLAKRTRLVHRLARAYLALAARRKQALETAQKLAAEVDRLAARNARLEQEVGDFKSQNERLQGEATDLRARLHHHTRQEVA